MCQDAGTTPPGLLTDVKPACWLELALQLAQHRDEVIGGTALVRGNRVQVLRAVRHEVERGDDRRHVEGVLAVQRHDELVVGADLLDPKLDVRGCGKNRRVLRVTVLGVNPVSDDEHVLRRRLGSQAGIDETRLVVARLGLLARAVVTGVVQVSLGAGDVGLSRTGRAELRVVPVLVGPAARLGEVGAQASNNGEVEVDRVVFVGGIPTEARFELDTRRHLDWVTRLDQESSHNAPSIFTL